MLYIDSLAGLGPELPGSRKHVGTGIGLGRDCFLLLNVYNQFQAIPTDKQCKLRFDKNTLWMG